MICVGIDAGSRTIKVVLFDSANGQIVAAATRDQGIEQEALALCLLDRLLEEHGIGRDQLGPTVATGYGRRLITAADRTVTEITCQAWGVRDQLPQARTIIDIGGQDSKLIRLDANGAVHDFTMNDRCAAGTGRFLEVLATRLGVKLDSLGEMSAASRAPAIISSMCVVFAETEIVGLLASGMLPEDIAAGVQASIATRVASMAGGSITPPVVFTGGGALVPGMETALEAVLGERVLIPPAPQLTGALGAAVLASQSPPRNHAT